MNSPHYILLPVSSLFIAISLVCAFFLNFLPWGTWKAVPDFVALALVFWNIHQPRKIGIGIAFMLGLFDWIVSITSPIHFGEFALAYTLLSYFAITLHKRVLEFKPLVQAFHILPLLLLVQVIHIVLRMLLTPDAQFPGIMYFSQSLIASLLWPLVTWLLLAPQRRAIDKDDTRPI